MRTTNSSLFLAGMILLILICGSTTSVEAAQFSATLVQTHEGDTTYGDFYLKGSWYRLDQEKESHKFFAIVDREGETCLLFSPLEKIYLELPGSDPLSVMNDPFMSFNLASRVGEVLHAGVDTINGYECDKYRLIVQGRDTMTKWVARKFDFPIRIINHRKAGMFFELQDIQQIAVNADLFRIPPEYEKMNRPGIRRKKPPEWIKDVFRAPVVSAPFERQMSVGELVKIKIEPGQAIRINARKAIRKKSLAIALAFTGGKPTNEADQYLPFAGGNHHFFETPQEADHIVIRVLEGKMDFRVRVLEMTEKRIPAGEALTYVINPEKITHVRFVNAIDGFSECEVDFLGEGEEVNEGPERFRRISLEKQFEARQRTWLNENADEMVIRVFKGEMILKLTRLNRHGLH